MTRGTTVTGISRQATADMTSGGGGPGPMTNKSSIPDKRIATVV